MRGNCRAPNARPFVGRRGAGGRAPKTRPFRRAGGRAAGLPLSPRIINRPSQSRGQRRPFTPPLLLPQDIVIAKNCSQLGRKATSALWENGRREEPRSSLSSQAPRGIREAWSRGPEDPESFLIWVRPLGTGALRMGPAAPRLPSRRAQMGVAGPG